MSGQELQTPPETVSVTTSFTHVADNGRTNGLLSTPPVGGEGESAIPDDKIEDKIEDKEDDWEHDPINPRNWSSSKKWTATALVSVQPACGRHVLIGIPRCHSTRLLRPWPVL